jgi:Flp pilus assembly pilin Flp
LFVFKQGGVLKRQSGASNTEYILIVVMIALTAMFMVKGLGVELRTLFSRSTSALNLFDGIEPEDGSENTNEPTPGPTPIPPISEDPDPTVTPSKPDHDAECQQQQAALQEERETEGASLAGEFQDARDQYDEAMRQERYWVPGHHSRWGGSSSGHWSSRYVHSAAERASAQEALDQTNAAYQEWNDDWNHRYHQWQSDCGH